MIGVQELAFNLLFAGSTAAQLWFMYRAIKAHDIQEKALVEAKLWSTYRKQQNMIDWPFWDGYGG